MHVQGAAALLQYLLAFFQRNEHMAHCDESAQIDPIVFHQTLEKKLADLPPLPAVVLRIMQTVNDPSTCAEDLNRLISLDQGLSSKMLRIVNSSYYGFPKKIG